MKATRFTCTLDGGQHIDTCSGDVEAMTGYTPEEFVGLHVTQIIPERLHDAHKAGYSRWRRDGTKKALGSWLTVPMIRAGGQEVEVELVLMERNGVPTALFTSQSGRISFGEMLDAIDARRALQAELTAATNIQESMLRLTFPDLPRNTSFSAYARMVPAKEVGGDFYDFGETSNGFWYFLIGDVSGKGVPAALFMAVVTTLLRSKLTSGVSASGALRQVNEDLAVSNPEMMFATVWIGVLDTSSGRLAFSNAGHDRPLVVRATGEVEILNAIHGLPVGPVPGIEYGEGEAVLLPGDVLHLYTDGVPEARNPHGDYFSDQTLHEWAGTRGSEPLQEAIDGLVGQVLDFEAGSARSDDITLLGVKYWGPAQVVRNVEANLDNIPTVLDAVDELPGDIDPTTVGLLKMALDDLMSNVVSYSGSQRMVVEIGAHDDEVWARVTDSGVEFDPTGAPRPDTSLPMEERQMGGLGIHLVLELMDRVSYYRSGDRNILVIGRKLASHS